jgi:hypothetical protein
MQSRFEQEFHFESSDPTNLLVDNGIAQLWTMGTKYQVEVLTTALKRFEEVRRISWTTLGFGDISAEDLVKPENVAFSPVLNDKDILTAVVMGNLDLFPLSSLRHLSSDSLNCGIWDMEFGEPGYFYRLNRMAGNINPGDAHCAPEMWKGPTPIPRVKELKAKFPSSNFTGMEASDGCIHMQPGLTYLIGYSPAVRTRDLRINLETRSNFGRYSIAGAVNSVTARAAMPEGYKGVLTAEAVALSTSGINVDTQWLLFQMGFIYVAPGLDRKVKKTFSDDKPKTLEEAARDFQNNPIKLLPKPAKREKDVGLIYA